jgi:cytochrome c-type protein NapC
MSRFFSALVSMRRGILIGVAGLFFFVGIGAFASYMTAVDYTNHLEFCAYTCHEMSFPFEEYKKSKHYQNEFGVRAGCPDCHVIHNAWPKTFMAKLAATGELYTHFFGRMSGDADKQKVFEEDRLKLAQDVWAHFKANDSRECRNCHSWDAMALAAQSTRAQGQHDFAQKKKMTCIDCHKGITHKPVHQQLEQKDENASFDVN